MSVDQLPKRVDYGWVMTQLRVIPGGNAKTAPQGETPQPRDEHEMPDAQPAILFKVNPRARRVSIRIDAARREAIVTAPSRNAMKAARAFAEAKAGWIRQRLAALPRPMPFAPGATIPVRGQDTQLAAFGGRGRSRLDEGGPSPVLWVAGPDIAFASRARRFLTDLARDDIETAIEEFAQRGAQRPARLRLSDTVSRWGSCSTSGTVSLSWRLIGAPPAVLRYVVAHELAHFDHMDHSPAFWRRVHDFMPDYAESKIWLKRHGAALHAMGQGAR